MHATKALQNGENPPEIYVSDGSMAERVGFEPTEGVSPQLISSQSRCDHFDTAPREQKSSISILMNGEKVKPLVHSISSKTNFQFPVPTQEVDFAQVTFAHHFSILSKDFS